MPLPTGIEVTEAHIKKVQEHLALFRTILEARGEVHDRSKFSAVELPAIMAMQDLVNTEGNVPYGSEAYEERKKIIAPMLAHHYFHNTHHPEHYPDGIAGMDLFDLVEMFADWKAASERGGDPAMGIEHCVTKYEIPPMLASILRNTADKLGWART